MGLRVATTVYEKGEERCRGRHISVCPDMRSVFVRTGEGGSHRQLLWGEQVFVLKSRVF